MVATEPRSAVVARIPLPSALRRLRARWDPMAAAGVPPHVTILFPYLPVDRLGPEVRSDLASIAERHRPFVVTFERVGRFSTAVYLAPEPAAPFVELTEAIVARFPEFPPYEGVFDEIVPHLTVCESDDAPLDVIAGQAAMALPFSHRVDTLEVLGEGDDDLWHPRWRLRLGDER